MKQAASKLSKAAQHANKRQRKESDLHLLASCRLVAAIEPHLVLQLTRRYKACKFWAERCKPDGRKSLP